MLLYMLFYRIFSCWSIKYFISGWIY